eukprot:TRINITY_DN6116_c1_g1_i2.p1 TRINITY_DN6116_c1_g1~~TRINITY_DN6116_c1_g1_i2.p1  ORF type:complete len:662 (+),score=184.51 TRINITY_DN6116_c1_g1_i2:295-1986(+)
MVWRVLKHEYHYIPRMSGSNFCRAGHPDLKAAVLIDVLRLVERHHNRLVDAEVEAATHKEKRKKWLAGTPSDAAPSEPPAPPRARRITLCLDEHVCDLDRTLSPRLPETGKAPGPSIYRMPAREGGTQPDADTAPLLIGGRFVAPSADLEESEDDQRATGREDHPKYCASVREGPVSFKGGVAIPDTRTAFMACADGFPLITTTNHLPPEVRLGESHSELAFSLTSTPAELEDAEQANPAAPGMLHGSFTPEAVRYVRKFPVMLERSLIKRIEQVAPCTCQRERDEMEALFAKHGRPPPLESVEQPRSFWVERARIMEKLKKQLCSRYPGCRLVFSEEPQCASRHDSDDEPGPTEEALQMTLSTKAMRKLERRECNTQVVVGMSYHTATFDASTRRRRLGPRAATPPHDAAGHASNGGDLWDDAWEHVSPCRSVADASTETGGPYVGPEVCREDLNRIVSSVAQMEEHLTLRLQTVSEGLQHLSELVEAGSAAPLGSQLQGTLQGTAELGTLPGALSGSSVQLPRLKRKVLGRRPSDPFAMVSLRSGRSFLPQSPRPRSTSIG